MFKFEKVDDVVYCEGDNFKYSKIGDISCFEQFGKLPSLRIIKTIIKKLQSQ